MKQVQFTAFGVPHEVAACVEVPEVGPPGPDEVVIEVEAFPINPADLLTITGAYAVRPQLPATLGAECAGRIVAVGSGVRDLTVGDRVINLGRDNWCQQRKVPAAQALKVPADADVLQLAMLKVNPATALMMLRHYVALQPGDWVIQDAANSGVGTNLIRLAKTDGIRTVNVVRREALIEPLTAIGADAVVVDGDDLAARVQQATVGAPSASRSMRSAAPWCSASPTAWPKAARWSTTACSRVSRASSAATTRSSRASRSPASGCRRPDLDAARDLEALYTDLAGRAPAAPCGSRSRRPTDRGDQGGPCPCRGRGPPQGPGHPERSGVSARVRDVAIGASILRISASRRRARWFFHPRAFGRWFEGRVDLSCSMIGALVGRSGRPRRTLVTGFAAGPQLRGRRGRCCRRPVRCHLPVHERHPRLPYGARPEPALQG